MIRPSSGAMPNLATPHDQLGDVTAKCLDTKHVTMSHDPACSVTIGTNWSDIKGSDSPQNVISNAVALK